MKAIIYLLFLIHTWAQSGAMPTSPGATPLPVPKVSEKGLNYFKLAKAAREQMDKAINLRSGRSAGVTGVGNGGDFATCQANQAPIFLDRFLVNLESQSGLIPWKKFQNFRSIEELFSVWQKRISQLEKWDPEMAADWKAFIEAFAIFVSGEEREENADSTRKFEFYLIPESAASDWTPLVVDEIYNLKDHCQFQTKVIHLSLAEKTIILYDQAQFLQDLNNLDNLSWALTHEFLWRYSQKLTRTQYDLTITRGLNGHLHAQDGQDSFLDLFLGPGLNLNLTGNNYYEGFLSVHRISDANLEQVSKAFLDWNKNLSKGGFLVFKKALGVLVLLANSKNDDRYYMPMSKLIPQLKGATPLGFAISEILNYRMLPNHLTKVRQNTELRLAYEKWIESLRKNPISQQMDHPEFFLLLMVQRSYQNLFGQFF